MNYNNNKLKFNPQPNNSANKNLYNSSNIYNRQNVAAITANNINNNSNKNFQTNNLKSSASNYSTSSVSISKNNYDEDDDLDISDSDLIRASQAVESQLKFTNNVHHTTSNAMNIFSQLNSTSNKIDQMNSTIMMPPPQSTTTYFSSQMNSNYNFDHINDDVQKEIQKLKVENMQKDGEVKILRDKLKKMEQDSQRMRIEREDLFKKLQHQQEEAKRALQKQIDIKELENQLKSQELVDLTMRYKVLESSMKKNNNINNNSNNVCIIQSQFEDKKQNNLMPSKPVIQQQQHNSNDGQKSKQLQQQQSSQSSFVGTKGLGTKRHADYQSSIDLLIEDDDDFENQLIHENKRLLLSSNNNNQVVKTTNNQNQTTKTNQLALNPMPQIKSENNTLIKQQPQNIHVLQNLTNIHKNNDRTIINNSIKEEAHINQSIFFTKPNMNNQLSKSNQALNIDSNLKQTKINILKRNHQLNTKSTKILTEPKKFQINFSSLFADEDCFNNKNDKLYELTNILAESTNHLYKFNSNVNNHNNDENEKLTKILNMNKKLTILFDYIGKNSNPEIIKLLNTNNSSNNNIERIELVIQRLNDELCKLINYLLFMTSLTKDEEENSKTNNKYSNLVFSIIDLLCLTFNIYFNLFLFRIKYLLSESIGNPVNNKKNKSINNNNKLITKLTTKIKLDFFLVISNLLKSIQFSTFQTNVNNISNKAQTFQKFNSTENNNLINNNSSKSSNNNQNSFSFSSYSTLKILITILNCFNSLLYLPYLNQNNDGPDPADSSFSLSICFYTGLVDNMHSIFKKFNLLKFCFDMKEELNNQKMDHEENNQPQDTEVIETDSEINQEEDVCLFELFYQKLQKYFGDVVYALELNELRQKSDDLFSNKTTNGNQQQNINNNEQQQMEIITTIAADDINRKNIDFKLDNHQNSPKLSSSRSQSELQFELQSQIPVQMNDSEDLKRQKNSNNKLIDLNSNNNSNNNMNKTSPQLLNSSPSPSTSNSSSIDLVSSQSIQFLQIEFLTNFIHFMHNYELFTSLEAKLQHKSTSNEKSTKHSKCLCYKDMFSSYLILIDYKFNEKFINGARLCFESLFKTSLTSFSSYLDTNDNFSSNSNENNINKNLSNYFNDEINGEENKKETFLKLISSSKKLNEDKKVERNNLNDLNQRYMYLMIIKSCHVLLTLFNKKTLSTNENNRINTTTVPANNSEIDMILNQKLKFLKSIKDDYRLKNFFCLYSLAESNFEDYNELIQRNAKENNDCSQNLVIKSNISLYHLNTSLSLFRNVFKSYIDDLIQSK